ncbi:G-protein coupled receptor 22 [Brienomyrus brachyistius]|uniref:G-protein coupled receptor 22 n=1 Tax=Brienomyrus brachyistius TaxID=42636 RepID=UPI0020B22BBF|nr:G-protein coupled receptor 22 [Brienomyrus brachyistius]XP_048863869.1 G-protein coupled receptor 22 [Brienomyrus brachyistius]
MFIPSDPERGATMNNVTTSNDTESLGAGARLEMKYPLSFQVVLTGFLVLEMVLGLSSNLTVLVLYCGKSSLVNSVSNVVTVNLHVLDVLICLGCIPLTAVLVLLPPPVASGAAPLCCFHEACVSFASVATAANVLAITLDRYDISVKPTNRVLNMRRAAALLAAVWAASSFSFLVPFIEVGFLGAEHAEQNRTTADWYYTEPGLYYHLLAQIPIFIFTAVAMLVTYSKIMQALNIRIGTRFQASQKRKACARKTVAMTTRPDCTDVPRRHPMLGMRASVSVIIALRRVVKRHRERRERQKRLFRMSFLIVATFLLCWTPVTVLNAVILIAGPGNVTVQLRLSLLVLAYATTVFHPLLYAFTRQKLQKALKGKIKKRVVSVVEVEPPPPLNDPVTHNSWIDPQRNKVVTFQDDQVRQKCFSSRNAD